MKSLIHIIRLLCLFITNIIDNIFRRDKMQQAGELVVIGRDTVHITLDHRLVKYALVKFKDEATIVPCNPKHFDQLMFKIEKIHNKHKLVISWEVSSPRIIEWHVRY